MAAVLVAVIIVTGAAVRLTGSGLGCPSWPNCSAGRLAPRSATSYHAMVEFVNRTFTGLVAVGVMAVLGAVAIVPMLRSAPPVRTRVEVAARSSASGARTRHVVFICVFFFAYVAYETTFLTWIATFTEEIGYETAVTGVSFMAGAGGGFSVVPGTAFIGASPSTAGGSLGAPIGSTSSPFSLKRPCMPLSI